MTPQQKSIIKVWGWGLRQVTLYLDELPVIRAGKKAAFSDPSQREKRLALASGIGWARIYELPPSIAIALFLGVGVPGLALSGFMDKIFGTTETERKSVPRWWLRFEMRAIFPLVMATERTVACWQLHQVTMNSLVERVREEGPNESEAFFHLVGLDPSSVSAKPLQRRIALAVLSDDSPFLTRLSSVIGTPPVPEHLRNTARLNGAMALMAYVGNLDAIDSPDIAYELFVTRARLYKSENVNAGARESLWKLVRKAQSKHRKKTGKTKSF